MKILRKIIGVIILIISMPLMIIGILGFWLSDLASKLDVSIGSDDGDYYASGPNRGMPKL